jgi:hypothetical protein
LVKACERAGVIENFEVNENKFILQYIINGFQLILSYFNFVLDLAKRGFNISLKDFSENELTMCLMLHYDVWQNAGGFKSLEESIK